MLKRLGLAALISLSLVGCDSSMMGKLNGGAKDAQALYMRVAGSDIEAMKELVAKADQGDMWASLQAGYILHTGTGGLAVNYPKAAEFYERAARLPVANYNLALLYVNGQVKPANGKAGPQEALTRLQEAAKKANSDFVLPFITLAQIYEKGVGVPVNMELAASWYEKAASNSDPFGMYKLGMVYLNGKGRPQNPHLAEKWFNNAADRWNTDAQLQLAMLMSNEDYHGYKPIAAAKWFYIASLSRPEYRPVMDDYFSQLNEAEQANARRLADAWMKGHQQMPSTPPYNQPTNITF